MSHCLSPFRTLLTYFVCSQGLSRQESHDQDKKGYVQGEATGRSVLHVYGYGGLGTEGGVESPDVLGRPNVDSPQGVVRPWGALFCVETFQCGTRMRRVVLVWTGRDPLPLPRLLGPAPDSPEREGCPGVETPHRDRRSYEDRRRPEEDPEETTTTRGSTDRTVGPRAPETEVTSCRTWCTMGTGSVQRGPPTSTHRVGIS